MAGLKAPTFEEIESAVDTAPAFEDIAPLAPDPELEQQRRTFVLDQSEKTGIPPAKLQRRQTLINQLFSDEDYEEAITSRKEEYANAGTTGVWMEFIDAEAQMSSKIGAAFKRAHAALVRWNPLWEPTAKEKAILETRAKRYEDQANLLWEVSKNPDLSAEGERAFHKAARLTGGTIPYITATTLAYTVAGPLGGFAVGGLVEGHSAYQEAVDSGVEETTARNIGLGVGIVNGAIESFGGKFTEEFFEKIIKKRVTAKIKQAGALFTLGTLVEALEEGSQEVATITGEEFYRDVDWKERITRIAASMAGGAFLGGTMRGMQIAGKRLMNEKAERPELKAELTAAIQETTGLPQEEAEKVAQDAINDKFHPELAKGKEIIEKPAKAPSEFPAKITPISEPKTGVEIPEVAEQVPVKETGVFQPTAEAESGAEVAEKPPTALDKLFYLVDYEKGIFLHEARSRLTPEEYKQVVDWSVRIGEPIVYEPQNEETFISRILQKYKPTQPVPAADLSAVRVEKAPGGERQPWEMLPREYVNTQESKWKTEYQQTHGPRNALIEHEKLVKQAYEKGEIIPRAVLEEYKSEKWAQEALAKVTPEKARAGEGKKAAPIEPGVKPLEKGPERKVSRAAQRVQEEAIAKDLTESLGELPTYETMSMQEQARMAEAEIEKDYENAKQMAYGKVAPPLGLRPASIYRAVAVKARNEADVETLRNLAVVHPQISLELTAMGQAIKAADVGMMADPVKAMQDVQKAKEKAVAKRRKIKDVKKWKREAATEAKAEIKKATHHRQSWSEFVETIRC